MRGGGIGNGKWVMGDRGRHSPAVNLRCKTVYNASNRRNMAANLNQKVRGILQIFRPELPFAAGVCVVLGSVVALGGFPSLRETVLGFLCGFFISGSAIVWN